MESIKFASIVLIEFASLFVCSLNDSNGFDESHANFSWKGFRFITGDSLGGIDRTMLMMRPSWLINLISGKGISFAGFK